MERLKLEEVYVKVRKEVKPRGKFFWYNNTATVSLFSCENDLENYMEQYYIKWDDNNNNDNNNNNNNSTQ